MGATGERLRQPQQQQPGLHSLPARCPRPRLMMWMLGGGPPGAPPRARARTCWCCAVAWRGSSRLGAANCRSTDRILYAWRAVWCGAVRQSIRSRAPCRWSTAPPGSDSAAGGGALVGMGWARPRALDRPASRSWMHAHVVAGSIAVRILRGRQYVATCSVVVSSSGISHRAL